MVNVAIRGRHLEDLRKVLKGFPIRIVESNPSIIISYGGDGALLGAEREFPGVPKLPLRDERSNPKCPLHADQDVLASLVAGTLVETELTKIEAQSRKLRLVAVNDIVVHNRITTSAVRYRIWLDDELYANRVVGDGLVVATPFGSTGYYRSITHSLFKLGIGLAFNNSTEPTDHLVIDEASVIRVEVLRGPAVVLADNGPEKIQLHNGNEVIIRKSPQRARVLGIDVFRCPACYRLRQLNPDAS